MGNKNAAEVPEQRLKMPDSYGRWVRGRVMAHTVNSCYVIFDSCLYCFLCSSDTAASARVTCTLPRTEPRSNTAQVGQLAQDYRPREDLHPLLGLRLSVGLNLSFWACRALNPRNALTSQSEQPQYLAQHGMQYHEASQSPRAQAALRDAADGIPRRHQKVPTALPRNHSRQPSQRM